MTSGCLGGCLLSVLAVVLVVGGACAGLVHLATSPYVALPAVQVTAANAGSAKDKLLALLNEDGPEAAETFSDDEASAAVETLLDKLPDSPLSQVVVHASGQGTLQAQARVRWWRMSLPLYLALAASPAGAGGAPLRLADARLGRIPLPVWAGELLIRAASSGIRAQADTQPVSEALSSTSLEVALADRSVTVRVRASAARRLTSEASSN
jgi:hypothetical protein